jgi:hypothetical protein
MVTKIAWIKKKLLIMDSLKKTVKKCKFSNGFVQTVYKFIDDFFQIIWKFIR